MIIMDLEDVKEAVIEQTAFNDYKRFWNHVISHPRQHGSC